jgi:phenylacetate-coenzyme A ligase PaaK-like adenylate-forming protein
LQKNRKNLMFESERKKILERIKNLKNEDFDEVALAVFHFQYEYNAIYRKFIEFLKINPKEIFSLDKIPFLPVQFFKKYDIKTGDFQEETIFTSSGTTGQISSKHFVKSVDDYLENTLVGFEKFYGSVENYCVLALLPSYLEREGSSLVVMAQEFIERSKYSQSGFYLYENEKLIAQLIDNQKNNIPTLLLGVTFALLDLADASEVDLSNVILMETGGMKGRRKEITREELHFYLKKKFNIQSVHSEYGMTELLSQGYSKGDGIFECCDTLKVITKEINDPFTNQYFGKNGVINLIDLANLDSCAFIATEDVGVLYENQSFEIKGRLDMSEMRGCNLMVE